MLKLLLGNELSLRIMGGCCCKEEAPDVAAYVTPTEVRFGAVPESQIRVPKNVDPRIVDQLVLEMLKVAASRVDTDEESPVSLVKLHAIADKEEGWIQMLTSMVNVIPLEDPFGPTAISILLDDCPLPSKESVIKVTHLFRLSHERGTAPIPNIQKERNICVILGCIAEKLVGPNSVAILTDNTLEYLFAFLTTKQEPCIVLFALIALIKFAHTTENKLTIKSCLEKYNEHPLLHLEKFNKSDDYVWRQVGFCANWAMDNLFTIEGRTLSYLLEDMSKINALLNSHDVSEYLQISSNGLEARCDSYSFESVRCTFQIDKGCWYYEATIVTSGVMQIGWATKNSHFLNDEGYGIGDDIYSISYDGCRKLVWYNAKPTYVMLVPAWKPGDVLGCLIDLEAKEVVFSLNGVSLTPCKEIFDTTRYGFFAAASFMAYQQCLFNFGLEVFKFPPTDRKFSSFNDRGQLTDEEKKVIPRRIYLEQLRCSSVKEDSCQVCYDEPACCVLEPCQHGAIETNSITTATREASADVVTSKSHHVDLSKTQRGVFTTRAIEKSSLAIAAREASFGDASSKSHHAELSKIHNGAFLTRNIVTNSLAITDGKAYFDVASSKSHHTNFSKTQRGGLSSSAIKTRSHAIDAIEASLGIHSLKTNMSKTQRSVFTFRTIEKSLLAVVARKACYGMASSKARHTSLCKTRGDVLSSSAIETSSIAIAVREPSFGVRQSSSLVARQIPAFDVGLSTFNANTSCSRRVSSSRTHRKASSRTHLKGSSRSHQKRSRNHRSGINSTHRSNSRVIAGNRSTTSSSTTLDLSTINSPPLDIIAELDRTCDFELVFTAQDVKRHSHF